MVKYAEIILDFSYFKISEAQDKKIEESAVCSQICSQCRSRFNDSLSLQELRELDEEIRENHLEILNRAYLAFESIHQYVSDLKYFVQELNDGIYIQQSVESVLQDEEGKQLLVRVMVLDK